MERRSFPRESRLILSSLRLIDGPLAPEKLSVCVSDVSSSGVGIYSDRPLKPGWEFLLAIGASRVGLLYRVVRCEEKSKAQYYIGGEFVCVVTPNGPTSKADDQLCDVVLSMFA